MGISGLLPFIKPLTKSIHIKEYSNQTLAIDGFILLHRASLIEDEFDTNSGKLKLQQYFCKWLDMFEYFKVKPYFVLDGDSLPSKEVTNVARKKARLALKESAETLMKQGRLNEANDALRKSRGVTPIMVHILLTLLKTRGIPFVVAPFEADAQLAYLAKEKIVAGVITEDSDLLVFGCPTVIFKLDQMGTGSRVQSEDLFKNQLSPFYNMDLERLRHICILSGCDYLPNIPSIGLKTSYKLFQQHTTLTKVRDILQTKNKYVIPSTYWRDFDMANQTFLYQTIYCPLQSSLKNLNPIPSDLQLLDYLKCSLKSEDSEESHKLNMIMTGQWCPKTLTPYSSLFPTPPPIGKSPLLRLASSSYPAVSKSLKSSSPNLHHYFETTNKLHNSKSSIFQQLYQLKGGDKTFTNSKDIQSDRVSSNGSYDKNGNSRKIQSPYFKKSIASNSTVFVNSKDRCDEEASKGSNTDSDTKIVKSKFFTKTSIISNQSQDHNTIISTSTSTTATTTITTTLAETTTTLSNIPIQPTVQKDP